LSSTLEVRDELERRAASLMLPYRVVVRAKLVLLAADGHANREIAARVDMSADRVAGRRTVCARGVAVLRIELGRAARAEDAIKPWQQRSWIFSRAPDFLEGGRVLDLYEGRWRRRARGAPLCGDRPRRARVRPARDSWP